MEAFLAWIGESVGMECDGRKTQKALHQGRAPFRNEAFRKKRFGRGPL